MSGKFGCSLTLCPLLIAQILRGVEDTLRFFQGYDLSEAKAESLLHADLYEKYQFIQTLSFSCQLVSRRGEDPSDIELSTVPSLQSFERVLEGIINRFVIHLIR
jgi:hypothetical protein